MIREPVAVGVLADQDEVAQVVARYNLLAVPVVDDEGRLDGIVTVDDAIDTVIPTAWKAPARLADALPQPGAAHSADRRARCARAPVAARRATARRRAATAGPAPLPRLPSGASGCWRLAVLGPGIVSGFADNDAGGITTYSLAGARFGYDTPVGHPREPDRRCSSPRRSARASGLATGQGPHRASSASGSASAGAPFAVADACSPRTSARRSPSSPASARRSACSASRRQ